ncbi:hypothetical protein KFE98_21410 [bacterium SCSIO 12741]|nr:hypothetical protein KFE98_21410 [bacterium SCSIO 12741]
MSLIEALYSGDHAKARSHIRNLIRIACADGQMDDPEYQLLLKIARKYELSEADVKDIIEHMDSVGFTPPSSKEDRHAQIWNLGRMVYADGIIAEEEVALLRRFAIGLGFPSSIAPKLVDGVIEIVKAESHEEDAMAQINRIMSTTAR